MICLRMNVSSGKRLTFFTCRRHPNILQSVSRLEISKLYILKPMFFLGNLKYNEKHL